MDQKSDFSPTLKGSVLGLALFTLFFDAAINKDTPFRAEHWALLYAALGSPHWTSTVTTISQFVCFGVQRFQPLAFFPTVLSYLCFGSHFFLHYLWSILLHVGLTYLFLKWVDLLREKPTSTPLFLEYPLEAALFLVLFPYADVMLWSFFHYVQWACLAATFSLYLFANNIRVENYKRLMSYFLAAIASLVYEPFSILLLIYLLISCYLFWKQGRLWLDIATPAVFIAGLTFKYASQFGHYVAMVSNYSELQRSMVQVPLSTKLWYLIYKTAVMLINTTYNIVAPVAAEKRNIYELAVMPIFRKHLYDFYTFTYADDFFLLASSIGILIVGSLVVFFSRGKTTLIKSRFNYALLIAAGLGPFTLIAWARPVIKDFAIPFQFRYAMIGLPFLVPVTLDYSRLLLGPYRQKAYASLLIFLVGVNAFSSVRHAYSVNQSMNDTALYVIDLKQREFSDNDLVRKTTETLARGQIPLRDLTNETFTYNAQKCVREWVVKIDSPEPTLR